MREITLVATTAEIRKRSHQIVLANGSQPGHERDDEEQDGYELLQMPISKITGSAVKPHRHPRHATLASLTEVAAILSAKTQSQFQ